ncbi:MAG: VPLPA-CTERM sorting domain-containing protein [Pseudomonadota bacterium]
MTISFKTIAAAIVAMSMGSGATAASFSLVGGTLGTIPDTAPVNQILDDPLIDGDGVANGFFGSTVELLGPGIGGVLVEFLGFEAGQVNTFSFGGADLFTTPGFVPGGVVNDPFPSVVVPASFSSGSILDFAFTTQVGNKAPVSVANGSNPDDAGNGAGPLGINFFATFALDGPGDARSGDVLFLFFDDDGANNDDNHDDMAIRLSIVPPIPLPAAGFLLLAALGGLGVASRRRKA